MASCTDDGEHQGESKANLVSILVCTHNRALSLNQTLDALERLSVPADMRVEVLVVDNACTDETRSMVEGRTLETMDLRYVYEPQKGLSRARNTALAHARGEFILFTDDDVVPAPDWLERMVSGLRTGETQAVTGSFSVAPHLLRNWMTPLHLLWLADSSVPFARDGVRELVGGNMGFRNSVLRHVSAFDVELGAGALGVAEETMFGWQLNRAGIDVAYLPDAKVVHHLEPSRLLRRSWIAAAIGRGRTDAYLRYHWEHRDIRFPLVKGWYMKAKLVLRRLITRMPNLDDEGCATWEMSYVMRLATCEQFCLEREKQRRYRARENTTPKR